jgi:hypothetical protein
VEYHSISAVIVVALLIVPILCLAVRDLAFVLRVNEDGVYVKWLGSKRTIFFTNIENIEGDSWGVILTDSSRRKIGFSRFLENYTHVREYLLRACQAGKVTPFENLLRRG